MKQLFYLIFIFFIGNIFPSYASPTVGVTLLPIKNRDETASRTFLNKIESQSQKNGGPPLQIETNLQTSPTNSDLTQILAKAHEAQLQFQDQEAAHLLEDSLKSLETKLPNSLESQSLIARVHLLLASCYKNLGQPSKMNGALEQAARLNPNLVADEIHFPPSLINTFEKAKQRVWIKEGFGQVIITSKPTGALAYVNGFFKGKTPFRLDRFPPGKHTLMLQSEEGTAYESFSLHAQDQITLSLTLSSAHPKKTRALKKTSLPATDLKAQKRWLTSWMKENKLSRAFAIAILPNGDSLTLLIHSQGMKGPEYQTFLITNYPATWDILVEKILGKK